MHRWFITCFLLLQLSLTANSGAMADRAHLQQPWQDTTGNALMLADTSIERFEQLTDRHIKLAGKDPRKAAKYLEEAMGIAIVRNDTKRVAVVYDLFGNIYRSLGWHPKALEAHMHVSSLAKQLSDDTMHVFSLNNVGNIYYDMRQFGEALDFYHKALRLADQMGFPYGKSVSLNNIGLVYKQLGMHDSAYAYHERALHQRLSLKNNFAIAHSYIYLGEDLINLGQYKAALQQLHKADQYLARTEADYLAADVKVMKSRALQKLGLEDSVWVLYKELDSLLASEGRIVRLVEHKIRMSEWLIAQNNIPLADSLLRQGLQLANTYDLPVQEVKVLKQQLAVAEKQGNFEEALSILKSLYAQQQTLHDRAIMQRISLVEAQENIKKKEEKLMAMAREAALKEEALTAQRTKNQAMLGIIIVLMILGLLILYGFYQKAKSNRALIEKNKIIAAQKDAISAHLQEAETAKANAEKYLEARTTFVSNLSHEIRTPMHAITGLTDLMIKRVDKTNPLHKNLTTIKGAAEHLVSILNDVLDMAKIDAGKITLQSQSFSLRQLADLVIDTNTSSITKPIMLQAEVDDDLPAYVLGDRTRLFQILNNLVNNAIKFTEKGSITLIMENRSPQAEEMVDVFFKIKDTGSGMQEAQLQRIFERFDQGSEKIYETYGGTGLGLSIAQKLTSLMGGNLMVKSQWQQGTEFYFSLPMKVTQQPQPMTEDNQKKAPVEANRTEDLNILYVEDNEVNRFLAEQLFQDIEVSLDYAENGKEAIDKICDATYHLVLMDIQMPIMDGIEATKWLRQHGNGKSAIPIIGFTADVMDGTREKAIAAGMNDIIMKPFQMDELHRIIDTYGYQSVNA